MLQLELFFKAGVPNLIDALSQEDGEGVRWGERKVERERDA